MQGEQKADDDAAGQPTSRWIRLGMPVVRPVVRRPGIGGIRDPSARPRNGPQPGAQDPNPRRDQTRTGHDRDPDGDRPGVTGQQDGTSEEPAVDVPPEVAVA
ncbi:hypothetical protein UK99_00300 [Frankia casuarinae]|nr:hypothetical protein UK99_00300 [Frankia casuarinae]